MKEQNSQSSRTRTEKIRAREAIDAESRRIFSETACDAILASEEYANAKTILIYEAIRAELSLSKLAAAAKADGKRLAYPVCVTDCEFKAYIPLTGERIKGRFGIEEPDPDASLPVEPDDIDLVICPCTAFDKELHRIGMGGGFYDRFLPKCGKAAVFAVAFEAQEAELIRPEPHDFVMDAVVTEKRVLRRKR